MEVDARCLKVTTFFAHSARSQCIRLGLAPSPDNVDTGLGGDEGVITVAGEQRQLGAGRGPDPSDDEAHLCGRRLALEGYI